MPLETVVNDVCSLRILTPTDAKRIFEIVQADKQISERYVTWLAGVESEADVAQRIEQFNANRALRYAIVSDGELAGYIGAWQHNFDSTSKEYDFGYLCDPAYRGRGLVVSSAEHMMRLLAAHMNAQSFALYINDGNEASRAVAKKLAFTRTEEVITDEILGVDERRWEKSA